ncbi:purine-binding chemotaxis protein CheW [Pontibacter qinzhouensis]|uniref:Purine-binding chemotaxis protein CheW n=1 Tax=Pontibacter qinzhouensis TaxID=2603253 RepID=A0A5C8J0Q6_9BACT|nr:chemotaxis protein CheW [Pontibacter qinzhouensis]TXK27120.1 purine-binding chemotaxis protein CheW [Pontibacter qinzhouensis]
MVQAKNGNNQQVQEPEVNTTEQASAGADNARENNPKNARPEELVHLVVFKLGTESYGIKIEQVKEVTVTPAITRMPRTPHFIKGVANIRGDIIAIMNLEERFGIRPAPVSDTEAVSTTYTLVIEAKDYSIGVVVREVPQSLNIAMSKIDKAPAFLQDISINENYIEGIAKVNNQLIVVLDMFKILTNDEIKQLASE